MDLRLKYQRKPFSISDSQEELWKVMHLRSLQRVHSLPIDDANELPCKTRVKLTSTKKVGPFIQFHGTGVDDPVSVSSLGLTLKNPFLSYQIRITSATPITDFAVYHGSSELQLCFTDKFTPLKYCGEFNSLTFVVTEYSHLYFVTTSAVQQCAIQCDITISKGAKKSYSDKRGCLRTRDQVKEVYRSNRVGNDFVFTCPKEVEAMYRAYADSLKKEQLPFPVLQLKTNLFKASVTASIHFERQEGYANSYCFVSVTNDRTSRKYIKVEQGTKLRIRWSSIRFSSSKINPRDWILRAYGAHSSCVGTWSCSRANVETLFDKIEYLKLVIENERESVDPVSVELVDYIIESVPHSS